MVVTDERAARPGWSRICIEMCEFDEDLAALDEAIVADGEAGDLSAQRRVAAALLNKGAMLEKAGRQEESLATLDALVERFATSEDEELRREAGRALHYKGLHYRRVGRRDEEAAAFEQAEALDGEFARPDRVAMLGAYHRALARLDEKHYADALQELTDVMNPWPDGAPDDSVDVFVSAMVLAGDIAVKAATETSGAGLIYDDVIHRYGAHGSPHVRANVALAMLGRAAILGEDGDPEAAVTGCTEALSYLGDDSNDDIDRVVASALTRRAQWLRALGRHADAAADYRAVLDRFADAGPQLEAQRQFARDRLDSMP
jgi:tetratricopeptide (TPR) repeat protein